VRRIALGLSQEKLAGQLGLTFQQVQKYEKGVNRVGSGRLHEIGRILGVSPSYFFEGLDSVGDGQAKSAANEILRSQEEGLQLMRAFDAIKDARMRQALVQMARAMAGHTEETTGELRPQKAFSHSS
jgi:transcriptional regulator with XRE-family HTH domain